MSDVSARAAAAKRLADDPMLVEALANIRIAATNAWQATATSMWLRQSAVTRAVVAGTFLTLMVRHPMLSDGFIDET